MTANWNWEEGGWKSLESSFFVIFFQSRVQMLLGTNFFLNLFLESRLTRHSSLLLSWKKKQMNNVVLWLFYKIHEYIDAAIFSPSYYWENLKSDIEFSCFWPIGRVGVARYGWNGTFWILREKETSIIVNNDLLFSSSSRSLSSSSETSTSSSSNLFLGSQVILFSFLRRRRALANQVLTCQNKKETEMF